MILPISNDTVLVVTTFMSIFIIVGFVSIFIEQGLVMFKDLRNV